MKSIKPTARLVVLAALLSSAQHGGAEDKRIPVARDGVAQLKYSPKGKFLAILDKRGVLTIRDTVASRTWGEFGRADQITTILPAFSGDETRLATAHATSGGEIRLWDLTKAKAQSARILPGAGAVTALAFGASGTRLAAGDSGGLVRVFDTGTGALLGTLGRKSQGPVHSLAFAGDGRSLAIDTPQGIRLWRLDDADPAKQSIEKFLARPAKVPRAPLQFSPDSKTLAISSKGNQVELIDAASGSTNAKVSAKGPVEALRFLSTRELAVITRDGGREVFDAVKGKPLMAAAKVVKNGAATAIAPESSRIAVTDPSGNVVIEDLAPDPRYTLGGEFLRIPVFYGTNRAPKTYKDDDLGRFFSSYFLTLSGLLVGVILLAAWGLPPAALAVWHGRRGAGRIAALTGGGVLLLAALWILRAWLWSLEAACAMGLLVGSALLFAFFRAALGTWLQLLIVLIGWLGTWIGIAFLGATVKVQREHAAPGDFYGNERVNTVHFGRCEVTIPRLYKVGSGDVLRPAKIFGIELQEDPQRHVTLRAVRALSVERFFAEIQVEMARPLNRHREAFVFLHGFSTTFQDAAFRTALLARDLEFPGVPILFSWPSWGQLEDYPADEAAAEYSRELFQVFLGEVARKSQAQRLYVIAHSMGNRVLTESLKMLLPEVGPERDRLKEVVLAAPDVDRQQFVDQVLKKIVNQGPRVTLYASSKDIALATSKALHKYPRAGQGGDLLVVRQGLDSIDASTLDTSGLSHDYAFTHPAVQEDIRRLCLEGKRPEERERLKREEREQVPFWVFEP